MKRTVSDALCMAVALVVAATLGVAGCERSSGVGSQVDSGAGADAGDAGDTWDGGDGTVTQDASTTGDAGPGCTPGELGCLGDDVATCAADGTWGVSEVCMGAQVCGDGACVDPCDPAALGTSNLGCTFWAVDLDNEASDPLGTGPAASAQIAVLIANPQSVAVNVFVYQNAARVGAPVVEVLLTSVTVLAGGQTRIDLPQREVDGSMGQNSVFVDDSGSGTFVSSHGYRILADRPVAAFLFNPVVDAFSNDAALLLPEHALGTTYTVIGWPTANPCAPAMPIATVPDHTAVTIIGVEDNTTVQVFTTHPIMASGGDSGLVVPQTPAGGQLVLTLGPYDVLNLESLQPTDYSADCPSLGDPDGDFTGTRVTASAPVVVFSSGERGAALGGATPPDPPSWDGESCCTDHLEEQLAPDSALGWQFAVARSPVRSALAGYREPDIYRFVATANNTVITTSLPSPFDQLTLQAGEAAVLWAYDGFVAEAVGGAVALGQYLVSQGYAPLGNLGDPGWVAIGPVAQMLDQQLVAIPAVYPDTYLVITHAAGAAVTLDGVAIGSTTPDCESAALGTLGTTSYEQLTCVVTSLVHAVAADSPVSVTVFGYSSRSSFAYAGGAGLAPINP